MLNTVRMPSSRRIAPKEKCHADGAEFRAHLLGRLVNVYAECFEAVRRAALRGGCTVAVLADLEPCRRCKKGRRRRDVDAARVVAARTDDVDDLHVVFDQLCVRTHGGGRS